MPPIARRYDKKNLVRELARNKVDTLELVREALSNAKDHGSNRVWIKTIRGKGGTTAPDIILMNDGDGMGDDELSAFWGVSSSVKTEISIGHKGHGTKLFFACRKLSVATRRQGEKHWILSCLEHPDQSDSDHVDVEVMAEGHPLSKEIHATELGKAPHGVAIWIEGCSFTDAAARLLSRRTVESYCDWFTVIGDIRAGLFKTRKEFHETLLQKNGEYEQLRANEVPLRPIELSLCINGEPEYTLHGRGRKQSDKNFLSAWTEDRKAFAKIHPGVLGFGHRFADHYESKPGAKRVRDDMTSLCLVSPEKFGNDPEYSIVLRVEGYKRQRETYKEASWQGHTGEYSFNDRFGLWLCKDFIPVAQQNEWLREAIDRAAQKKRRLRKYELKNLRNWQAFVNCQNLTLTANRNDISNLRDIKDRVVSLLAAEIEIAFDDDSFAEWIANLQSAVARGMRDREVRQMEERVDDITKWFKGSDGIELATLKIFSRLEDDESVRLPEPKNEQELFYVYSVLSGIYQMPLRVLEYNAREGIDAVAQIRDTKLFSSKLVAARVEFKNVVTGNTSIGHFFAAIDVIVCWKVELVGPIREGSDLPDEGLLRKRKPQLTSGLDTHEIIYTDTKKDEDRIIPVLTVSTAFESKRRKQGARRK